MNNESATIADRLKSERAAFAIALVASLAFRLVLILFWVDPDTDSYGHFVIARELLWHTKDWSAHWVWLPLLHWFFELFAWLSWPQWTARVAMATVSALSPVLLVSILRQSANRWRAGLALTCMGLFVSNGASAVSEPLFLLLALSFVRAHQSRHWFLRWIVACLCLCLTVLLRYEAWFLIAALGAAWALRRQWTSLAIILPPTLTALVWLWARWGRIDLTFAAETRHFVREAVGPLTWQHVPSVLARFTIVVPFLSVGPGLLWVRRMPNVPREVLWIFGAFLLFLTAGFAARTNLGIGRHVVIALPIFAIAISESRLSIRAMAIVVGGYGIAHCLLFAMRGEAKLQPERAAAAWVQSHWTSKIHCEIAEVESLTNLPPSRFRGVFGGNYLSISRETARDRLQAAPYEARFVAPNRPSIIVRVASQER